MNKSEQVYQHLRKKLLSGELSPGEHININDVVEELNVSRTPVREALKRLEAEDLVEIIHNVGAKVRKLDLDEMEQLVLIRQELEPLATKMAAEHVDEPTLKRLHELLDRMDQLHDSKDVNEYTLVNREFHMELYRASKAKVLYSLIDDLWTRSERSMMIFSLFPERPERPNVEHRRLVQALEARDGELAAQILRDQKAEGFINVIRLLKEYERIMG